MKKEPQQSSMMKGKKDMKHKDEKDDKKLIKSMVKDKDLKKKK